VVSRRLLVCALLATLVLSGCQRAAPEPALPATRPATPSADPRGPVTKLLVLVVENHSLDEMRSQMPEAFGLAERYGYATQYRALTHPSLPNYLAMAGGDTFGVADDDPPTAHVIHGPSVFGQALEAGRTAKVYAEGMPGPCAPATGGERYAVRHNPWAYFVDERDLCERLDVPLDDFAADAASGDLPDAGLVVPDLCHDAHDEGCDLAGADAWIADHVRAAMAGPDFAAGRLAIVVTADEDDRGQDNLVLTIVVHPSQEGHVVDTPLTHYSLTRLYDEVLGVPPLRHAASAPDMAQAFGLPLPPGQA
jgi:acid phosphatase